MKQLLGDVFEEIDRSIHESVEDLAECCRFASTRNNQAATIACADWLKTRFERAGFESRFLRVPGSNPLVYARIDGESPRRLLLFNHYDVEVPGSSDAWTSPPFVPTMRDGNLYARGTADNKGSLMARIRAVECLLRCRAKLPCGVVFAVEAKTEIFSRHFESITASHRDFFRADACLWENALNGWDGRPTLRLGDKGMCALELKVEEDSSVGLSSQYAALTPGAAWRLVWILSGLRPKGHQPGWLWEGGNPLSPEEEVLLDDLPLEPAGNPPLFQDAHEQARLLRREPTFNLTSFGAGIHPSREAPLSSIPREAVAYLDLRLLPGQDPSRIIEALGSRLAMADPGVRLKVLGQLPPHRTPIAHPFVEVLQSATRCVWNAEPRLEPLSTASGSRHAIGQGSDVPIVGVGIAYPGSKIGRPDEHVRLEDFRNGIKFIAAAIYGYSQPALS